ncbi:myb/SANT-like DNA-binding domain-containing protein 1 [Musca vetustissima]|uniref:myb/SANT-like DNA-binding domain-containing protein 1 n=1 Tax=Musca vetustissima TaxID=27455 RepID=UPI002AB69377|nr:myb/SANT-like DNA-binding domain-containing protein 1 [Musca vetustissima]
MSKGKERSVWCDSDTHHLLQLWEERANDLRRAKRNGHIYQDIAAQMNHKFTAEEVQVKIRNFTQKYRDEKMEMGPSGGSPSKWKFFEAVHRIIESNAANNAEVLESFLFKYTSDSSNHPETSPLSPSPQPYLDVVFPPASPSSSSSAKKRNNLGEVIKIMKEQNDMLKCVVEDSQCLSNQIVSAIREQNETSREFINLMKNVIDKI